MSELVAGEFLGRPVTVVKSTNPTIENVTGYVVDETKNMFVVHSNDRDIKIPKSICRFSIDMGSEKLIIDGKFICYRPENRLKELRRITKNIRKVK
ncbi:MAG: ribonuclease P protein subunit [Candidatus Thermoplasmatota archaeon]|jgi:ribonuclease P protein subunit POP4|nr:ribonuclease P protein subunit [Candidatus Thermoplasmatota archaeon]MCL5790599.1 ribonuclease P protein subunit [Candidatus Thermoplasmatota archaeon]